MIEKNNNYQYIQLVIQRSQKQSIFAEYSYYKFTIQIPMPGHR